MMKPKIYKHNAIVEASFKLSITEQRIILNCISQIRRDQSVSDDVLYRVTIADMEEFSGVSRQTAWEQIRKAEKSLWERYISLPYVKDGKQVERKFRWIQEVQYVEQDGYLDLRFSKGILPYLSDLTERFTSYLLSDIASMTSVYGIRLFELLVQWEQSGKREFELEWLRHTFQLEDKYQKFSDFKKRVIIPAVEQINQHSPLSVTWSHKKTGRKITHVVFSFVRENNSGNNKTEKTLLVENKNLIENKPTKANRPKHVRNVAESAIKQMKMNLN